MPEAYCPGLSPYSAGGANTDVDYEGWTICDDPTCGHRTRIMSVYSRRCLQPVSRFR
jgi:hypothetical protein